VLTIVIALLSIGASVAYLLFAVTRVKAIGRELRSRAAADRAPGITVLKPICGLDPELERNLSSFYHRARNRFPAGPGPLPGGR
jgi:hypothetical protein